MKLGKRKERELNASVWPNDKLRVVPTHHQNAVYGRQVLSFRPTEVIDDPYRIKIMDELGIEYRTVSTAPKASKPVAPVPPADEARAIAPAAVVAALRILGAAASASVESEAPPVPPADEWKPSETAE